jgi:outer membrane immunogenic protein
MRKILMLAATLAVGCMSASLPSTAQGRPDMWAGAYAGINLGQGKNSFRYDDVASDLFNGVVAGGRLGYNLQSANWVYGVELNGSAQFGQRKLVVDHTYYYTPHTHTDKLSVPLLGDVRGRLGYAFGSTLLYGFGGLGAIQRKTSSEYNSASFNTASTSSKAYTGMVFGAGAAYKFSSQLSADLEIARYQIGQTFAKSFDYGNGVLTPVVARAGISYHFN